ncbi:MAG: amino acid ABC transporter permease [Planctomycetota bacterium]|jgi:His/Glu/Gln/Arg/opine family amino acid ABC transporter permease subunit|nr:amino acid ABC transporter permease [Planctomycetota bacterium]
MGYQMSWEPIGRNLASFAFGIAVTLFLTAGGVSLGMCVGVLGAVVRFWRVRIWRGAAAVYIECIRNTPFLLQLYFVFFGLPSLGILLPAWLASILAMTLNLGAYATEIIRAGLESLPRGLSEAGFSLGMTRGQVFRHVLLRPALKTVWPAICGQIVIVMLGTSVCSQIAVKELSYMANLLQSSTFRAFEIYLFTTVAYLVLAVLTRRSLLAFGDRVIARGRG